jgi:NodT family efflux transporter outer membrane factor (OMF) lipoprotein
MPMDDGRKMQSLLEGFRCCGLSWMFTVPVLMVVTGCTTVGPNYARPELQVMEQWMQADPHRVLTSPADYRMWWTAFRDPVLDNLVQSACAQNIPLRVAGARVFEARARLGIAIGEQYPQVQQAVGAASYNRESARGPSAPQQSGGVGFDYQQAQVGATASWEIDFWGKFRRAVESEDANFLGSIAAYDNALVSLTADVARTYVIIRTLEERLGIAQDNVIVQTESLRIAEARFQGGATSERDVQQALSQLRSTEATIPQIEATLRQAKNALCTLLGVPPRSLDAILGGRSGIPAAPIEVAVGIPADLLRRRPDIRSAELQASAQCALIGVAKADLYPAFTLTGTFGFLASDVGRFHLSQIGSWDSRTGSFGPAFAWNILNYGQITNSVRLQDARFQESIFGYQDTVLRAQQEVEDGLTGFLQSQIRLVSLEAAAAAAKRSADLALIQYREGATDYTTVLTAQAALLAQQDSFATGRGDVPQGLVAVYRALGGGWEIRDGQRFLPADVTQVMGNRTNWGGLLEPAAVQPETERHLLTPDW